MKVKQISVFLENKAGRLALVTKVLGEHNINIRALSIADTTDFGILRLIVSDPDQAYKILKEEGFTVSMTDVIAVEIDDRPGGLSLALAALQEMGLNIEYLYAFLQKTSRAALVVFRVERLAEAVEVLRENGFNVLAGDQVYTI